MLERVGGALVAEPARRQRMRPTPRQRCRPARPPPSRRRRGGTGGEMPQPVARLLAGGLDAVRWRWIGPGVWHRPLADRTARASCSCIKAAPGASVPEHGHGGSGADAGAARGASSTAPAATRRATSPTSTRTIEHKPVADADAGCICLIASEKPARFRGLLARLHAALARALGRPQRSAADPLPAGVPAIFEHPIIRAGSRLDSVRSTDRSISCAFLQGRASFACFTCARR